jgi:glutamyl-tRNA reductase
MEKHSTMSNFVLIGLNHRTAPLDIRQMMSINSEQLPKELRRLSSQPDILESVIFSTCNRVEILVSVEEQDRGVHCIESFLSDFSHIPVADLQPRLYQYLDNQAIRHVFRVSSSLDSMILGEPQILGQVKSCYSIAVETQTVGTYLNGLLQSAFKTAKRVRTETSIGEYPVSASSAAVELARKVFGDLQKRSILIVGTGKMGETAVRHLADSGVGRIYVTNRSFDAAQELASRFNGIARPFDELANSISLADIVITSTGASEILIGPGMVHNIMRIRKNSPIIFIDISVPRNVDPAISHIEDVFCYDVDDLAHVVEANLNERVKAAASAEKIVDQEVRIFSDKIRSLKSAPLVSHIQGRIDEICQSELQRSLRKMGLLEPKQIQEMETMVSRIAAKISHPLVMQLRNSPGSANEAAFADLIKQIFKTKDGM